MFSMRNLMQSAALCLLTVSAASTALADDVSLALKSTALAKENPSVTLNVNKDLRSATLKLRAPGARYQKTLGPKQRGGELLFVLPHKSVGKLKWNGTLDVSFKDGSTGSMPLAFETERVTSFSFKVLSSQDEIREQNQISISMQRPCSKVELEAYGDDGVLLASVSKAFNNAKPGTKLTVSWDPKFEGPPLHVRVKAFDDKGVFSTVDSFPYVIDVPHDDVEFQSGKAQVQKSEEPKLVAAIAPVKTALVRYQKAVKLSGKKIRLFVLGHTDTVGPSGFNRQLSNRRAMAIARWFRNHGVTVDIYARGFGEDRLKVETADNVDEAKNRRVDYRVAVESPTNSLSGWTRVK